MTRRWPLITTITVLTIALAFVVVQLVRGQDSGKEQAGAKPGGAKPAASSPGVPGGLESASSTPKKHDDKGESQAPSGVLPSPGTTFPSTGTTRHTSPTGQTTAQAKIPEHAADKTRTTTPAPVVIKPVAKLHAATSWKSDRLQLGMQADGNLVLYDRQEKRVLWAAGTSGEGNMAAFQDDGNLVIYTAAGRAIWASNPAGFTNATLVIQPDGNVVIMAGGKQVWATNTHI
ncbi:MULTISPECIES: hypothetical protein [unclassified Streptomyces]|uniref:hypothetical protein n=1 Tax=unclassified Streptomyces TaxID=2593676 RepID=UPI002254898C|nr:MULTISPECIES: hypothetical protein [unclassified Streptomyces]WSP56022.1 hypothetical protein OG306_17750 [Streptomyces sp. NBC_01241]WSU23280.1 hypothetical protein OG508_21565 [Streptomyces sp. NBC_01108]MCX4787748.1 hypothetical protein [Streptomyces sp. NBC_01221]MCX4796506.1 hypothetical protein [Streptomyces sp. NBC_01242]WSJ37751.1 hypothetical protein OG772_18195 [Streptomyces sp. NBC_01321]